MRETARILTSLSIAMVALLIPVSIATDLYAQGQQADDLIIADQADTGRQMVEEVKNLKMELDAVRNELERSNKELASQTEMYQIAEDALRQQKEHVGQLQGLDIKLNEKEHEIVTLREQQESLEEENRKLKAEMEGLRAKTATAGEESAKAARQRAEIAEQKLKEQEKEVNALKETVHALKYKLEAAERHLTARAAENEALARSYKERDTRLAQLESTLKIAEAAMLAAQAEAATKERALLQVHKQWFPPWAERHLDTSKTKASLFWVEHLQPAVASLEVKARQLLGRLQEQANPHVAASLEMLEQLAVSVSEAVQPAMVYTKKQHTRLMPTVREKWERMAEALAPRVEALRVQLNEATASTADFLRPRIEAAKVATEPYLKMAHETMKPTVDVVIEKVGPHAEPYVAKAREWTGAAKIKVAHVHSQVSRKVTAILLSHELTSGYVDKNLVWYMTTALMMLPLLAVWIIISPYIRSSRKESEVSTSRPRRRKYYPKQRR